MRYDPTGNPASHPNNVGPARGRSVIKSDDPELARCARLIVESQNRIADAVGGDLFGNPALSILLELFLADHDGVPMKLTSLAPMAQVPQSTGLRYASTLEQMGMIERQSHPHDRRVVLVRLTPASIRIIRDYLAGLVRLMKAAL